MKKFGRSLSPDDKESRKAGKRAKLDSPSLPTSPKSQESLQDRLNGIHPHLRHGRGRYWFKFQLEGLAFFLQANTRKEALVLTKTTLFDQLQKSIAAKLNLLRVKKLEIQDIRTNVVNAVNKLVIERLGNKPSTDTELVFEFLALWSRETSSNAEEIDRQIDALKSALPYVEEQLQSATGEIRLPDLLARRVFESSWGDSDPLLELFEKLHRPPASPFHGRLNEERISSPFPDDSSPVFAFHLGNTSELIV